MYICPTCSKELPTEEQVIKHFLSCWKENNLNHDSKQAPRIENTSRKVSNEILDFFSLYGRKDK